MSALPVLVAPEALAERVLGSLKNEGALGLGLDYDGTLVPIAPRPEEARPDPEVVQLLSALGKTPDVVTAVVSGRRFDDLRALFPDVSGVAWFGEHGGEGEGLQGERLPSARFPRGERALGVLSGALAGLSWPPGARIETKRFAVVLHVRESTREDARKAGARFREMVAIADPVGDLRLVEGKEVLEACPRGLGKGLAVAWIREQLRSSGGMVVYVGDDLSDEDAFRCLGPGDLGALVSEAPRGSRAFYRLSAPDSVRAFLSRLVAGHAGPVTRVR